MQSIMKTVLVVAALIVVAQGTITKSLRARFALDFLTWGETSYIKLPQNISEANSMANWTQTDRSDSVMPGLEMWCYEVNYCVCSLFENDTEMVAGLRISIQKDYLNVTVLDMKTQGYKEVTYTVDGSEKDYWCYEMFFTSEASQQKSATERNAARDYTRTLYEDYLYVEGTNGELMSIPADFDKFIANTTFTEQACIPFMGHHYYDNMSNTTECTAEGLNKNFLLMHSGELVGLGTMIFPSFTLPSGQTDWFEHPTTSDVKLIVTKGPTCLYDMCDTYGVTTIHVYFIETPRTSLTCLDTLGK